jgi:hypothetical protein
MRTAEGVVYDPAVRRYEALPTHGWAAPLRDGRRILESDAGRLVLYDRAARRSTPVLAVDPDDMGEVVLSRDEQRIYFTICADEADVWLAEMR